jgi:hypothetical protein
VHYPCSLSLRKQLIALTLSSSLDAGVSTMYVDPTCRIVSLTWFVFRFVGLAEDPQVLAERAPELFEVRITSTNFFATPISMVRQMIREEYPQVVRGVNA